MSWDPESYLKALHLAARRHRRQVMKGSGLPYLVHLTSVAAEVMRGIVEEPVDEPDVAVACALLHDSVEDTIDGAEDRAGLLAEIARGFGDTVQTGVLALSKDERLPKPEQLADSLRRIRACPREVWCVKLADRITNLQEPPRAWDGAKRRRYREDARTILAELGSAHRPLAERLAARIERYGEFLDP